jgi:ATP-dependent Clp protease ATP-binding subunit ClpA
MRISVPIYVQQRRTRGAAASIAARPLFHPSPDKSGAELGRVIAALSDKLRVLLSDLAREPEHDELLSWHHAESIRSQLMKMRLDLRDRTADLKVMLASVTRHGQLLAFSPSIPELWFDIRKGETLQQRAEEVYTAYFRRRRKEDPTYEVARHSIEGKAWVDHVTIDVLPQVRSKQPVDPLRAFLGGEDVSDGAAELRKTSRCLNWIDVDDLAQPIGVDDDVARLLQLLDVGDRRGVVLVGPPGSGKTARIEGAVRRRRSRSASATHALVWQLSPARLISGMSYLGQWQERVLAIIRHAHRYDHVLYFDDLLGLYEAGKTRDSAMCVADTLRAQLDVYPIRVLAEMTQEAWAIFRERDRTLADRFVVIPTAALGADQSLEILIGVQRRLEAARRCCFELDVLPEVVSMYDRFERSSVLPGKAAAALARLAARGEQRRITRDDAVSEFQSRSGLQSSIIDRRISIDRGSVTARIRRQVVGQDQAVSKLVDRVLVAASRMNDTSRPLGTFLLVGPTGVGKTQLAKAIASCLFDDDGLIRLDMNELSSPGAAARLVGTFDAPDGLLTSAVRRRPNAVLLLDEIEKAHAAVLDVLLQALGEARLSDARGRTVDLSGLLILMTSNLGSRESGRRRGFSDAGEQDSIAEVHLRAAREFFRPEFFNRIDDVLSFDRLSAEVMQSIALMQFQEILQRDGLQRRSVLIDVDPRAIRQTAQRGYDPALGARALKRQIERDLVGPAAEVLAASKTDQPTLLRLYLDGDEVQTRWQPVQYEVRRPALPTTSVADLCDRAWQWLAAVADQIEGGPLSFEVGSGGVDPTVLETMTLRDSLHQCQQAWRELQDAQEAPRLQRPQATPVQGTRPNFGFNPPARTSFRDLQAIDDIQDYLRDSLVEIKPGDFDTLRDQLIDRICRLDSQLHARGSSSQWLLWLRWFGNQYNDNPDRDSEFATYSAFLAAVLQQWAGDEEELAIDDSYLTDQSIICCSGALALATLQEVRGGWMFVRDGKLTMADVRLREIAVGENAEQVIADWKRDAALEPISPVRRIVHAAGPLVDLQTGAAVNETGSVASLVKLLGQSRRGAGFLLKPGEVAT